MQYRAFVLLLFIGFLMTGCQSEPITPSEGKLTFGIDYPDSKDNFFLYHVLPKELQMSFKNDLVEMKIKKASMENTLVLDNNQKDILAYYQYDKVLNCNLNPQDILKIQKRQPSYKIQFTHKKDTLLGFDIEQAIAIDPKQPNRKIEIWFTRNIKLKAPNWYNGFEQVPGVMLRYEVEQYGMRMEFKAKKFEAVTIPDSIVQLKRPGTSINHKAFDQVLTDLFASFQ